MNKNLLQLPLGITLITLNFLPPTIAQTNPCDKTIAEADQLYLEGDFTQAEQLYRQCKPALETDSESAFPEPFTDISQLSPRAQRQWKGAQDGLERGLESKVFGAVTFLNKLYPGFVPAYILAAQAAEQFGTPEQSLEALEKAANLFPFNAEIAAARVKALEADKQWLEASIAARQFAILNPQHPQADEYNQIADTDFGKFRGKVKTEMIGAGILGGIANILTGGLSGGIKTVQLAMMMIEGESEMGSNLAEAQKQKITLIEDEVVIEYVTRIGNDMVEQMGKTREFTWEFNVVEDETLNAFVLPGGKVFVNTGTILNTKSEAELAGVVAHEVAHAVLSHGYQRIANANLFNNLQQVLPFGNVMGLVSLDYSRANERQADILATRGLAGFGYAADGLRNFFVTLNEQTTSNVPEYLSTHPASESRIQYLEELIVRNGYNRFSYEGIREHQRMQNRLQK